MGSHLAVRFARRCVELGITIERLILLAPDPKFYATDLDRDPLQRNAYREARKLWAGHHPGSSFLEALESIPARVEVTFVYSRRDDTAAWVGNVELLPRRLGLEAERLGWLSQDDPDPHWHIFKRFRINRLDLRNPGTPAGL